MELFGEIMAQTRNRLDELAARVHPVASYRAGPHSWPGGVRGNIVLQADTAVELGNPRDESASFVLWTENPALVESGRITVVGPDIPESRGRSLPFGKAVFLLVEGFDAHNCYEHHREIELARYDVSLKGYMMRGVSQYLREWSRVSREAAGNGFTLRTLGEALVERYMSLDYVAGVECVFVTSSTADVRSLQPPGEKAARLIGAMNRMASELSLDCGSCGFSDVCAEVDGLRAMRSTLHGEAENA